MLKCRMRISFFYVCSAITSSADMLAGGYDYRARLVLSMFLMTSLATMKDPILACFAKKTMTLSLATLILIFALLAFVTVREIN